ncbi:MAG: EAL domain-containing protein [Cohaesibacteraceae bacterium]
MRRRYARRYLSAMALLAITIMVGGYQLNRVLEVNARQAEVIDVAGAQRMLSQRLALLADRVLSAPTSYRYTRALEDLELSVERMKEGHVFLSQGRVGFPAPAVSTPALQHHYDAGGAGLGPSMAGFLRAFEEFLQNPEGYRESIEFHRIYAERNLLVLLDQAVALHTQFAQREISQAIRLHGFWVAAALVLLVLEVLLVFRPMGRDAAQSVARVKAVLDERTAMLSRAFHIAKLGHWHTTSADADPIWLSQELIDMYGMDREEGYVPLSVIQEGDIVPEGTPIAENEQHQAFLRTWESGEPTVARSAYRKENGEIIDMLVHMDAQRDASGKVVAVTGVIRDVTDEVAAERALRDSLEEIERQSRDLNEAQRLGKLASWRVPIDGTMMEWNNRCFELLGYDPDVFTPTVGNIKDLYEPQALIRQRALNAEVMRTGERQSGVFQVRRGDGSMADLDIRVTLERDGEGKPRALFGTMRDVSQEKSAQRELEALAYRDPLTGLANRASFTRQLDVACALAQVGADSVTLIVADLDQFKDVNDTLGHQAGDELLRIVGERLSAVVDDHDFVARLGGDEFAILLSETDDTARIQDICDAILKAIGKPAPLAAGTVTTGASLGVAIAPKDATEPASLMRYADLALYASKEHGRGRASFFEPNMNDAMRARAELVSRIRVALQDNKFEAHFQPLVSLQDEQVVGFETLLRLPDRERGFIPPSEFIPVAEGSQLIADLGAYVLHEACHEAQSWVKAGLGRRKVAVNVSAAQIWHGDLEAVIDSALTTSGLDPRLLCLEVTETVFAGGALDRLHDLLTNLKAQGVELALDDFGTGYSSLGYLNSMPFDIMKIDRTFVDGSAHDADKQQMLRGIISLGHGLGLRVLSEGVETAEDLAVVRDLGGDLVQGWYFGKALPAPQALADAAAIDAKGQLVPVLAKARQKLVPQATKTTRRKQASRKIA